MKRPALDKLLEQAQNGNQSAREELINSHRSFVAKISSRVCKRYLSWENDDELSIALLAFNEAIDGYDRSGGANFHSFARKVIGRKLVDYFRKESRHRHVLLSPMAPDERELMEIDEKCSLERYKSGEEEENFAEVVNSFNETLTEYRISLADLVKASPKHRDTKEALLNAAQKLAEDIRLFEHLYRSKQLPLKELEEATGLSRRVLEKGRKYIVAVTLILACPKFRPLKNFLQLSFGKE